MTPLLKEILERSSVEDIVLCSRGVFFYEAAAWRGPYRDSICDEKNIFVLSRKIAEKANVSLGLTQPSADSFIDFQGLHFFRAHVVVAPMALRGIEITLRRIQKTKDYALANFTDDQKVCARLRQAVVAKKSMLIVGATGAGKSSLVTACLNEIPATERVLILEDSPELPIPNALSVKLLARTDRFGFREGAEWDLCHLVFESLRMRPDRIVVGECRGPEARAIYQALLTGHRGLITTLHAGSATEAVIRFDELVQSSSPTPQKTSADLWNLIVVIEQKNQVRRIKEIHEKSL